VLIFVGNIAEIVEIIKIVEIKELLFRSKRNKIN